MALHCPRPLPSSPAVTNKPAFSPSSSFFSVPSRPLSPSTHQFPAATQLQPTLIERRGAHCRSLPINAFHACPDALNPSLPAPASTLYQVLQVPQTATQAEIKAAFRRLARIYHPDASAASVEGEANKEVRTKLFLQIHSAYAALSDAESRARYDLQLCVQALRPHSGRSAAARSEGYSYPTPRASPACSPCSSRIGRSWETDQCW